MLMLRVKLMQFHTRRSNTLQWGHQIEMEHSNVITLLLRRQSRYVVTLIPVYVNNQRPRCHVQNYHYAEAAALIPDRTYEKGHATSRNHSHSLFLGRGCDVTSGAMRCNAYVWAGL